MNPDKTLNKNSGQSLLFIGPGTSVNDIDLNAEIASADKVACLNDGILYRDADYYFVGEKFIFDYVLEQCPKDRLRNAEVFFLGLPRNHKTRIDVKYVKGKKQSLNSHYFVPARMELEKGLPYDLDLSKKFSDKNMLVLSNLLHCWPKGEFYYIRSRTLCNALQVCCNLGFDEVKLIGFMDSPDFKRSDYTHQKGYVKKAQKINPKIESPQQRSNDQLLNSFQYQSQILKTAKEAYRLAGKKLTFLNDFNP